MSFEIRTDHGRAFTDDPRRFTLACQYPGCGAYWVWALDVQLLDLEPDLPAELAQRIMEQHGHPDAP